MCFLHELLALVFLLGSPASAEQSVSLWGRMADFSHCSHWAMSSHVSIPALQELTVCFHLQAPSFFTWTAFMYRPGSEGQRAELGLGGKRGHIVVWLFGLEWTTQSVYLQTDRWHYLCLTWSQTTNTPVLYVNGRTADIEQALLDDAPPLLDAPKCCQLAPNGTLTLGAKHLVVNGEIQVESTSHMRGRLTLFRLWGRAHTKQEVMSHNCVEGDVVKWEKDFWDTLYCTPVFDNKLQCEWSLYEVSFRVIIMRSDGRSTDLSAARHVVHSWLTNVLPTNYLHSVSVFDPARSHSGENMIRNWNRWASNNSRYGGLAYLNVNPSKDVATVQREVYNGLKIIYIHNQSTLIADEGNIYTTPIELLPISAVSPVPVWTTSSAVTTTTTFKPTTNTFSTSEHSSAIATTSITNITISTAKSTATITTSSTTGSATASTAISTATSTTASTTTGSATASIGTSTATSTTASTTTGSATASTAKITSTTASTTTGSATASIGTSTATSTTDSTTTGSATASTAKITSTTASTTTGSATASIGTSTATSTTDSTTTGSATASIGTSTATSTTASTTTGSATTSIGTSRSTTTATTNSTTASGNTIVFYFEVMVNVSIQGHGDPELSLFTWLNASLPSDEMMVLTFQLLSQYDSLQTRSFVSEGVSSQTNSRESCVFQVQVMSLSDSEGIKQRIRFFLELPYSSGSVTVETQDILISHISILQCPAHAHQSRKGLFNWPVTHAPSNATLPCPGNPHHRATRHCKLCLSTNWIAPDLKDCPLVVITIPDLDSINVTAENAPEVLDMIESLLSDHSTLSYQELVTVLNKLKAIVDVAVVTPTLGGAVINIISDILESDNDLLPFTNTILNITEAVGDRMWGYEEGCSTLVAPVMAISVVDVVPGQFTSLTFGVSSVGGLNPEIYINKDPYKSMVAFISLPKILQQSFPQNGLTPPRIQFQFFGVPKLFKFQTSQSQLSLNTFVVAASVTNTSRPITDLAEDVKVTLHHIVPNTLNMDVQCVYWNFNKHSGHGGWDSHGCRKHNTSTDYTTCLCNHLTHFGVLMDVSRTPLDPANEKVLTIITYLGCGISSLFLGVTVLTYISFEKLRRDYPAQILIHLSLALLGLNLVFLVNSWLSSWGLYGLCVAVASTLHYFLLASFTWMGLEAVNMYLALVKVFNVYVPSYMLKFCALGWGLPLLVCVLVLIVNREAYGSRLYTDAQPNIEPPDNSEDFCWLQDDVTFYLSVVGYAALVFLFNTAVFVVVALQLRHMRANRPAGITGGLLQELKGMVSLTLLVGLTWMVGFFTWGPARIALLYLFSGLNTLQGLFIFIFHCLMKENVRKQWRVHLCFGRFRLEENSEWSHSASVGVVARPRPNPPVTSVPSVRSVKSSATESTSASSDSSSRDSLNKRHNLGLIVSSMALPRARRSSSPLPYMTTFPNDPYTSGWLAQPHASFTRP